MSNESEQYKAQLRAEQESRVAERLAARHFILTRYGDFGLDETDRDEILGALGLTDESISSHGSYEARTLSRAGLGSSRGKAVGPRTPPMRGQ